MTVDEPMLIEPSPQWLNHSAPKRLKDFIRWLHSQVLTPWQRYTTTVLLFPSLSAIPAYDKDAFKIQQQAKPEIG